MFVIEYAPDAFDAPLVYDVAGEFVVVKTVTRPLGIFGASAICAQLEISVASKSVPVIEA